MATHILGIRHHGPGSARSVRAFLTSVRPDIILIEGPPEANGLLQWVGHEALKPPVALLVYPVNAPSQASLYPFAVFSPEWQALSYAQEHGVQARFIDLPCSHSYAMGDQEKEPEEATQTPAHKLAAESNDRATNVHHLLSLFAQAAGYDDDEQWWEETFEQRQNTTSVFDAVLEMMRELRNTETQENSRTLLREAYMRQEIRRAEQEGHTNIAVVCGAWHSPALVDQPLPKADTALLKNLSSVKVQCTWIPWTYTRLSIETNYGAGIRAPGWYDHLWHYPDDDGTRWLTLVASLLRSKNIDISVAHVIEAVRLASSLASLRSLPRPGLPEFNDAALSALCHGERILLQLIDTSLVINDRLGTVPADIPRTPLQVDIEQRQKKLRMPPTADWQDYTLDLRQELHLQRSILLYRLRVIGIDWGKLGPVQGKGTFKELWRLQWQPSFVLQIIEQGVWGTTLAEAAEAVAINTCNKETSLQAITQLLHNTLPAELPAAVDAIAQRIDTVAASNNDLATLTAVLPNLIDTMRYGNVRNIESSVLSSVVDSIIVRICVGLPTASCGINEDAAEQLVVHCTQLHNSIQTLQSTEYSQQWDSCLADLAHNPQVHALIRGFAARQLMDRHSLKGEALYQMFFSNISNTGYAQTTALWLEGFLRNSGTILLIDDELWRMLDSWVTSIDEEAFVATLPLLRRTVSTFTHAERRKLGEKARQDSIPSAAGLEAVFDHERATKALPVVLQLLGIRDTTAHRSAQNSAQHAAEGG